MALRTKDGHADKGVSLARGPALVLGSILLAFGLLAFLADGTSPTDGFPDGEITDFETILGIGVNDWTAFFTATAGGLLLFGAAQHLLAKTMSLLVGLALGACSVIALVDGDVLGLAAANGWTKLGWGIAAAILLINALLPRKGGKGHDAGDDRDAHRGPASAPRREPAARRDEPEPRQEAPASRFEPTAPRDEQATSRFEPTAPRDEQATSRFEPTLPRSAPSEAPGQRGRFGDRDDQDRGAPGDDRPLTGDDGGSRRR